MGANTSNTSENEKGEEEDMFNYMNLDTLGINFNETYLKNDIAFSGGGEKMQMPIFGGRKYKNNYDKYNVSRALYEMENNNSEMKGGNAQNEITQVLANELDYIMDGGFGCNCGKNNYKCDCNNKLENKNKNKHNPLMPNNSFYLKGGNDELSATSTMIDFSQKGGNNELSATSTMIDFSQKGGNILSETSSVGGFSKNSNRYNKYKENSVSSSKSDEETSSEEDSEKSNSVSESNKSDSESDKSDSESDKSDSESDLESNESDSESNESDSESNESASSDDKSKKKSKKNRMNNETTNSYSSNHYSYNKENGLSIFPFNSTESHNSLSDRSMRLLRRHM